MASAELKQSPTCVFDVTSDTIAACRKTTRDSFFSSPGNAPKLNGLRTHLFQEREHVRSRPITSVPLGVVSTTFMSATGFGTATASTELTSTSAVSMSVLRRRHVLPGNKCLFTRLRVKVGYPSRSKENPGPQNKLSSILL